MFRRQGFFSSLVLAAAFVLPLATTGCAVHRVYDPDHNDYHHWNNHETTFYVQWEGETHRDHREFAQRNPDEQKEYWNWRHAHPDR
jgi:hypothetical protein